MHCTKIVFCLLFALVLLATPAMAQEKPIVTKVVKSGNGWQLLRGGKPYYIRGAGGSASLELLAKSGGNSLRTWGVDGNTGDLLDKAHKLGISVTVGIWLGHERHGFNYDDAKSVQRQYETAVAAIKKYKDHPAVLAWGIGNEMEGFKEGNNPKIWNAINQIAEAAKKIDPNHPTMTVIAEIGGKRIASINQYCPAIDIVGANTYGGAASLPARYQKEGGVKPLVITEYGPPGTWEVGRDPNGAAIEMTSTAKGAFYKRAWDAQVAAKGLCFGSYAFTWGNKREATATWFGMLLPDGCKLEAVDAMQQCWTGKPPQNRCPQIASIKLVTVAGKPVPKTSDGKLILPEDTEFTVQLQVTDPEGDPLKTTWVLERDGMVYVTGGDAVSDVPGIPKAIVKQNTNAATFTTSVGGGQHRVYAYVRDGKGGAAVANIPVKFDGKEKEVEASKASIPFVLYGEGAKGGYVASGWMGDMDAISMDHGCTDNPKSGKTCIKVQFDKKDGWGSVVWQSPEGDWGDKPGGLNLNGASKVTFWARGSQGGEDVSFSMGIIDSKKPYYDSATASLGKVRLSKDWRQFTIDLKNQDLSRIKSPFCWNVGGQGRPLTFYLDEIKYEK